MFNLADVFQPVVNCFFVAVFTLDVAGADGCRINERYAGTFTQTTHLQKDNHWNKRFLLQFYKTVAGNRLGKIRPVIILDVIDIE
ncbi:hypothetical protein FACS189415_0820 [Bacteroidia bacterium]|nr:hypothetical protein FACS189415_0820 [Bacteroidia bacterium]